MANNRIQIKRTSVSGRAANTTTLTNPGELALNMADGILYSTNGSAVFEIGANNTNVRVTGNLTVKGIIANGSIGTSGQVLATNGSAVYWTTDQTSGNVTANAITTNTLAANYLTISTGTLTVGNSTVNTDIGNNYISVGNSTSFANIYSTYIRIGNSTVTSTINSTSFTGTANTATYLGAANNTGNSSGMYTSGVVTASGVVSGQELTSTFASGDEGGQINLTKPPNATTDGGIVIDAYQNRLRIYENGGSFRGAYIDLTAAANGVGSNLLAGGGGGGGFTNGQSISVNNFVITGAFSANSSNGTSGQVLTSNGSAVYWSTISSSANSQTLTGNGSNTVYTLSTSVSDQKAILVTLDGLVQIPNTDYSANGTTLTFTQAPTNNTAIEVRYLPSGGSGGGGGGGGATGGGSDQAFYENDVTITTDYTITTNKNAMTAGPITINSGVTVTVPSGSNWTIV